MKAITLLGVGALSMLTIVGCGSHTSNKEACESYNGVGCIYIVDEGYAPDPSQDIPQVKQDEQQCLDKYGYSCEWNFVANEWQPQAFIK